MKVEVKAALKNEFETLVVDRVTELLKGSDVDSIIVKRQKTSFGAAARRCTAGYNKVTSERIVTVNLATYYFSEITRIEEVDALLEIVESSTKLASEFFVKCDKKFKINH